MHFDFLSYPQSLKPNSGDGLIGPAEGQELLVLVIQLDTEQKVLGHI